MNIRAIYVQSSTYYTLQVLGIFFGIKLFAAGDEGKFDHVKFLRGVSLVLLGSIATLKILVLVRR